MYLPSRSNISLLFKFGVICPLLCESTSKTLVMSPMRMEGTKSAASWKELEMVVVTEQIMASEQVTEESFGLGLREWKSLVLQEHWDRKRHASMIPGNPQHCCSYIFLIRISTGDFCLLLFLFLPLFLYLLNLSQISALSEQVLWRGKKGLFRALKPLLTAVN